jgi:hypothetical protein
VLSITLSQCRDANEPGANWIEACHRAARFTATIKHRLPLPTVKANFDLVASCKVFTIGFVN